MSRHLNRYSKHEVLSEKVLAQGQCPTVATSFYSPADNVITEITRIEISNTTNSTKWFSMWHDPTGTTYNDTTKLFHRIYILKNTTIELEENNKMLMNGAGNLAFMASVATSVTVTVYGIERQKE